MRRIIFILGLMVYSYGSFSQNPDRKAVYNAILDYVEAIYESSPERIERSVHPDLVKRGFYWKSRDGIYSEMTGMTFDQLKQVAKDWNKSGWLPDDAEKNIEIYEVKDKTAVAKLTAYWGTDYFHLAKMDGRWLIMNVLWQAEPKNR